MPEDSIECTVMFADVSGSTQLYEQLGNTQAQECITGCLREMSEIVKLNLGVIVKSMGDEIMCRFGNADDAVKSACEINEVLTQDENITGIQLHVHIGMHYGVAVEEEGDLFGDAVNIAARVTSIAKAMQVLATEQLVNEITPDLAKITRRYDKVHVKGVQDEIVIHEIVWDQFSPNQN